MHDFQTTYAPVVGVTLAYFLVYYAFMGNVLRVKLKVAKACREKNEKFFRYSNQYPELLAADRIQLNMLEHMGPFLALLWMQALLVSVSSAALLGAAYVGIRSTYPLFMGPTLGKNIPMRLLFNTFSGYAILGAFVVWQIFTLLT